MTDEEIKKIARELTRLFVHPDDYTPYREEVYRQVEATITQLSKDYAIVPKSKVKEVYDNHIDRIKGGFVYINPQVETYMRASLASAMWRLFGKDMFEE